MTRQEQEHNAMLWLFLDHVWMGLTVPQALKEMNKTMDDFYSWGVDFRAFTIQVASVASARDRGLEIKQDTYGKGFVS